MRFPVFSSGANPRIDSPILRKSKSYVCEQVAQGRAHWVDPNNYILGIVARETLYFGERAPREEPKRVFVHREYQHHLEPKIERLHAGNSEWMAYLEHDSARQEWWIANSGLVADYLDRDK